MNVEKLARLACLHDKRGDDAAWCSALFCSKIVNNPEAGFGATLALAGEMGRSPDTIEDRAHAYWMYERLCAIDRRFTRVARRLPYVHLSHFRALYDIARANNLTDYEAMSLLMDIVQAEGSLSSRNLSDHARERYGDGRDWTYFGARAMKEIHKTLQQPDTPRKVRDALLLAHEILDDASKIPAG